MLLQARHDVDAVAHQVGAFDGHLAHVDGAAQPQAHVALGRELGDGRLDGQRRAGRVDRAGELDQQAVAQRLEDASAARAISGSISRRSAAPCRQRVVLVGLDQRR